MSHSKIKRIMTRVEDVMSMGLHPAVFEEERKSGGYRYTQFTYNSLFPGALRELHPNIRFELTSFMHPHPYIRRKAGSFIEQYLVENAMENIIEEF